MILAIGADADSQGEDDGGRESRRFSQPPQGETDIAEDGFESRPLPCFPAALFDQGHVSELAPRNAPCLLVRQPCFHQLIDLLLKVFAERN